VDSSAQAPQEPVPEWDTVKQVLSYFVRNPKAADTLEGVARWRLLEEQVRRNFQQTEAALAWLVTQGLLEEVETAGSRIFRLNAAALTDAVRFLADSEHHKECGKKPAR
jgi:hypothetical protein